MQLKRLGTVLHSVKAGYIVAKLETEDGNIPPLGVPVYDEARRRVGTLLDIIGPVKEPYAVVKPQDRRVLEEVKPGTTLLYEPPRPRRREKQRRRKQPKPVKPRGKGKRGEAREQRRPAARRPRRGGGRPAPPRRSGRGGRRR